MHTPWGRYKWLRLAYGLSNSPEEFQMRMHESLDGLEGVFCIADDILVFGQGNTRSEADKNHDVNVLALMKRLYERNLKLNPQKVQFKMQKITFMGSVISEAGIQVDPSKVNAIIDMPVPEDRQAVMRFCGMVNYLSSFCPNLSTEIQPLYNLVKEGHPFLWTEVQGTAFTKAKALITEAPCLSYFDIRKPVHLQVDASQRGLGGALMQPNENGKLQPVAYTSCQMRPNEEAWAQIEKECLAIVSACDKWDQWIYGLEVTVQTDHQPLETIFKKPLSSAPRRLQKMLMRLQRYNIQVVYKKGSTMVLADTLSRATLPIRNESKQSDFEVFRVDIEQDIPSHERITSLTLLQLRVQTLKDESMKDLARTIISGWPMSKDKLHPSLTPYWTFRDELTVQDGLIYKGSQVVIPAAMRATMLQKIHGAHLGAESNYRMCRDILFWPGMKAEVIDNCNSCGKCAQYKTENQKEPMKSQPVPTHAWEYVSQDIFYYDSENFLVTVDHFSDFIEVDELSDTLASTVADKTEAHFARNGGPVMVLTDNGPQFIAHEYAGICEKYGTKHVTSSPYWPQGNGKAEASVKIVKRILQKCGKKHMLEALLNYRNTPQQGHEKSPAQRNLGRRTRGLLPIADRLLIPEGCNATCVKSAIQERRSQAKMYYDQKVGTPLPEAQIGDTVYLKPSPHNKSKPWLYGVVTEKPTPRSYIVDTPKGQKVRRNRVQLRPTATPPPPVASQPMIPPHAPAQSVSAMPTVLSVPIAQHNAEPPHMEPSIVTEPIPMPATPSQPAQAPDPPGAQTPNTYVTRTGRVSNPPDRLNL